MEAEILKIQEELEAERFCMYQFIDAYVVLK
jgi:hypothetical protein